MLSSVSDPGPDRPAKKYETWYLVAVIIGTLVGVIGLGFMAADAFGGDDTEVSPRNEDSVDNNDNNVEVTCASCEAQQVIVCSGQAVCASAAENPDEPQVWFLAESIACNGVPTAIVELRGLSPGEVVRLTSEPAASEPIDAKPAGQDGTKTLNWFCEEQDAPQVVRINLAFDVHTESAFGFDLEYQSP